MAAAYAVVLQALLGSLLLTQTAAAGPSALPFMFCAPTGPDGRSNDPIQLVRAHCALCASFQTLDLPPAPGAIAAPEQWAIVDAGAVNFAAPPTLRQKSPRLSQGPPQAG